MFDPLLGQRSVTTGRYPNPNPNPQGGRPSVSLPWLLCTGCAAHGTQRARAFRCRLGAQPLLQEAITVPVYGDTAHLRRHLTARPTSKKGGTLISLRIISWKNTSSAARASIYVRLFHCLSKAKKLKTVRCFPPKMLFRLIKRLAAALAARLSTRRRERLHSQVSVCHGDRHACPAP